MHVVGPEPFPFPGARLVPGNAVRPRHACGRRRNDRISALGALSFRNSGRYRDGNGVYAGQSGQDLVSGLAKVGIQLTDDQSLDPGFIRYRNAFALNSAEFDAGVTTLTAKHRYDPESELIDLTAAARIDRFSLSGSGNSPASVTLMANRQPGFVGNFVRFYPNPFLEPARRRSGRPSSRCFQKRLWRSGIDRNATLRRRALPALRCIRLLQGQRQSRPQFHRRKPDR